MKKRWLIGFIISAFLGISVESWGVSLPQISFEAKTTRGNLTRAEFKVEDNGTVTIRMGNLELYPSLVHHPDYIIHVDKNGVIADVIEEHINPNVTYDPETGNLHIGELIRTSNALHGREALGVLLTVIGWMDAIFEARPMTRMSSI